MLYISTAMVASFLFTVLVSVPASMNSITRDAGNELRVIVTAPNAYMLPLWYCDAIRKMPGVVAASASLQWGAVYRDPRDLIIAFGEDPDIVKVYPEGHVNPEGVRRLITDRRAAMVGKVLMEKNRWHLDQPISLKNGDGRFNLTVIPVAVLEARRDQNALVFRRELLDEAIKKTYGVNTADRASFIVARVDKVSDVPRVIQEIDGRFHNSEYETSTITQNDAITSGLSAVADLGTIIASLCAVVLVTVLLILANTIAIGLRERISEVAVVRALGFEGVQVAAILFGEVAAMALIGGVAGAAMAIALFGKGITLGAVLSGVGYMQVTDGGAIGGVMATFAVSMISAIIPITQATAISPALAFSKVV